MEMSPTMLEEFLAGAREAAASPGDSYAAWLREAESVTDQHARTFIGFALGGFADLPEPKRMVAAEAFLQELAAQYESATGAVPEWVQRLVALLPA
jgi:hypothetical protein